MILIIVPLKSFKTELLEAYCLGKSWIWNLFFGWRKTIDKGINGIWCYYKINSKDYEVIQKQAEIITQKYNF